jgi:hypothetical protein
LVAALEPAGVDAQRRMNAAGLFPAAPMRCSCRALPDLTWLGPRRENPCRTSAPVGGRSDVCPFGR